ncbi:YchJ family protein [Paraburkholderia bonniea]|uniref:YchJ family protein n=1 Tax=Paraburkholderia bonniea TaxID=2152891 RepID=UPI001FED05E7|nr:YchJ family protein [Paraburkholderia bonniea]WJF90097.1 YchJ family protein [Paraburkholderia bonniea]WJF93411.1 YchJ family protein [Paraburkholderia bonniea]
MKHLTTPQPALCPCGGALPGQRSNAHAPLFAQCCGRFLEGGEAATNALELMRSRYSAYVLGNTAYLRTSWAEQTCPATLETDASLTAPDAPRWLGLQINRFIERDAQHAEVEFVARYKVQGRAHRLQELSRFVRGEDGHWRYLDGDVQET